MGSVTALPSMQALVRDIEAAGVEAFIRRGKLALAPASRLTPDLRRQVVERADELLAQALATDPAIRDADGLTAVERAEEWHHEMVTTGNYRLGITPRGVA